MAKDDGADEDLVEDPLAVDSAFRGMTQDQLAEAAREAQERTRAQWEAEEAERKPVADTVVESVADISARLAAAAEREREREVRDRALAAERKKWEAERAEQARRARIESWEVRMTELYPRFRGARLSNLDQATAAEVRDWLQRDKPGALLILGNTGAGKTWTAFAAAREIYVAGGRTRFWPVPNLLDALRPGKDGDRVFLDAREVDLLALDDIGVQKDSSWTMERLYIVVNDRWIAEKRTVVTSNFGLKDLREMVGDRMFSRLRDDGALIQLSGSDRRTRGRQA